MVTHEEDPGTGQPCPYCAAAGHDCSHLLGVLDLTFASCEGGFSLEREHELYSPIHAAFSKHLIGHKSVSVTWDDPGVQELWESVPDDFVFDPVTGDPYVPIDKYLLIRFLGELFESAGACWHSGVDCCGMPGLTSALKIYFVPDPGQAFSKALDEVGKRLVESAKGATSGPKTGQADPQPPESTEGLSRGLKLIMELPNLTKIQGRMGFVFPGPEPPRKK